MARILPFALPGPVLREDWIRHFIDHHTLTKDAASPDDLRKYPQAFVQMLEDHNLLHTRLYTGHEHEGRLIVPGRLR